MNGPGPAEQAVLRQVEATRPARESRAFVHDLRDRRRLQRQTLALEGLDPIPDVDETYPTQRRREPGRATDIRQPGAKPLRMFVYGLRDNLRYSLIRGNIGDWLRAENIPVQNSNTLKGWTIRTERVGDLIARAEYAGVHVQMKGELSQ